MYVYICLDFIEPFAFYSCSETLFTQRICLSFTNSSNNPGFFLKH